MHILLELVYRLYLYIFENAKPLKHLSQQIVNGRAGSSRPGVEPAGGRKAQLGRP